MEKRGFLDRFKRLSKPTGSVHWGNAVRAVILMAISGLIAHFLGFDNGIPAIMFVTLLATIIIDIPLPIRKVAILTIISIFMTALAFICASLALSNIGIFIFFTLIWAFFGISLYIFGNTEGSLGFTYFLIYFVAVLMVNNGSTPIEWAIFSILPYLVVSILFIPKMWLERKRLADLVTVGFNNELKIENTFVSRSILSGIPLKSNYYDIFKFGSYFKGLRVYSDLIDSRLPSNSRKFFENFLKVTDELALKISDNFKNGAGPVDLERLENSLLGVKSHFSNENSYKSVFGLSKSIKDVLDKSNSILSQPPQSKKKKIGGSKKSLKDVLNANFNINNLYIRHAIRFTLAMTIALIFVYLTRDRSVIWVTMGILIILKPDITSTIDSLISRVGFNLFAVIIAIILSFIFPQGMLFFLAFIMLFLFRAFYPGYMGLAVMAITVFIVLIWPTGTVFENAVARIVDISIGGIIAFICAYIILPNRIIVNLPYQLIKTTNANLNYAQQVLVTSIEDYDYEKALKCFKNYMMADNNFEAGLRKLEDTFADINEDLELYNELMILNKKIAADLTITSALLNEDPEKLMNSTLDIEEIRYTIKEIKMALKEDKLQSDLNSIKINYSYNSHDNEFEELLNWIRADLDFISRGLEVAAETGALSRYTKLS